MKKFLTNIVIWACVTFGVFLSLLESKIEIDPNISLLIGAIAGVVVAFMANRAPDSVDDQTG